MPYTPNMLISVPAPGDPAQRNQWGSTLDTNFQLIDSALGGIFPLSVAGSSNVVLTSAPGAPDQSRYAHYELTGALTGDISVLWPQNVGRTFSVFNNTTGAFSLACGATNGSGAPGGSTITIKQGATALLFSDGVNVGYRVGYTNLPATSISISNTNPAFGSGSGLTLSSASVGADICAIFTDGGSFGFVGLNGGNLYCTVGLNGGVYLAPTAGSWSALSDARFKNIAAYQTNMRDAICGLWIGEFAFTDDGRYGFGLLAQQAHAALPDGLRDVIVGKPATEDGKWTASAEPAAYLALWGVKDLYAEIAALRKEIADLRGSL
jgi:hypothetical protein